MFLFIYLHKLKREYNVVKNLFTQSVWNYDFQTSIRLELFQNSLVPCSSWKIFWWISVWKTVLSNTWLNNYFLYSRCESIIKMSYPSYISSYPLPGWVWHKPRSAKHRYEQQTKLRSETQSQREEYWKNVASYYHNTELKAQRFNHLASADCFHQW